MKEKSGIVKYSPGLSQDHYQIGEEVSFPWGRARLISIEKSGQEGHYLNFAEGCFISGRPEYDDVFHRANAKGVWHPRGTAGPIYISAGAGGVTEDKPLGVERGEVTEIGIKTKMGGITEVITPETGGVTEEIMSETGGITEEKPKKSK